MYMHRPSVPAPSRFPAPSRSSRNSIPTSPSLSVGKITLAFFPSSGVFLKLISADTLTACPVLKNLSGFSRGVSVFPSTMKLIPTKSSLHLYTTLHVSLLPFPSLSRISTTVPSGSIRLAPVSSEQLTVFPGTQARSPTLYLWLDYSLRIDGHACEMLFLSSDLPRRSAWNGTSQVLVQSFPLGS